LARAVVLPRLPGDFALELVQGDLVLRLRAMSPEGEQAEQIVENNPFGNNLYAMRIRMPDEDQAA
jgi:hypothetical protein